MEGVLAEEVYELIAVDSHTFTVRMSNPLIASISRFNATSKSGNTVVSYGCTLSGRTVTFYTTPSTGGTAILTVKGRT